MREHTGVKKQSDGREHKFESDNVLIGLVRANIGDTNGLMGESKQLY